MKYAEMSRRGIRVSRLCFGSLTVGPLQKDLPLERAGEVIAYALRRDVNFIDTAQLYENYDHIREGIRQAGYPDVVISTKSYAYTRELAVDALEEARRKLNRDVIDIFMLHEQESVHTLRGHMEALEYFLEMREKGVIRAVGASMHHIAAVDGALALPGYTGRDFDIDIIHPIYNKSGLGIADGDAAGMADAMRRAHDAGIGVFSMKPLGGGHLTKNAAEAFDFVLSSPFVDAVAVGMQSESEIDANIAYFDNMAFPDSYDPAEAVRDKRLFIEDYCAGCGKCTERCHQGALKIDPASGKCVCDHEKCVLCGYCSRACELFAIKVI